MSELFFRIECDDLGIYDAVERDCSRDDERRKSKPDGSWLPKVGTDYPGAISFWTWKGLGKYFKSGLKDWHASVVRGRKSFISATLKGEPIVWVNGTRYQLNEGDSVAFPSGTGVTHCFINESGKNAEFIVSGERTKNENLCAFPLNPEQKVTCGIWWESWPKQEFGEDSPKPLKSH